MWHEARKQERKIRGMIVDFRKRAERRQDFYEKIKADPTQFMQIHGRKCKIHLDPAIAAAGDGAAIIVPWQGQKDNLIDRFDVRAHLDYIPPVPKATEFEEITNEERQCNYERYRILAQNDFLNIVEDKFLHQLFLEEQFGANATLDVNNHSQNTGNVLGGNSTGLKKKQINAGAAIAYNYDDADSSSGPFSHIINTTTPQVPSTQLVHVGDDDDEESESDIDMDVSIEITKLDNTQAHELNGCGRNYGMLGNDFFSYLHRDADEADAIRMAREEEAEKIMLSGRKSRRERRAQREKRCAGRPLSPPSYAAKEEPANQGNENESGDSRSPSPENSGKITYITSFGGEDELQPHTKISINVSKQQKSIYGQASGVISYADKVKENLAKIKNLNEKQRRFGPESPKKPKQYLRSRTRTRSRSRSYKKRRSKSRSYRRSNSRNYRRSRSRDRSFRSRKRRSTSSDDSNRNRRRKSRSKSSHRRRNSRTPIKLRYQGRKRFSRSNTSSSSYDGERRNTKSRERSVSNSKMQTDTVHTAFGYGESIVPTNSEFNAGVQGNSNSNTPMAGAFTSVKPQLQTVTSNKQNTSPMKSTQVPTPIQTKPSNISEVTEVPIKRYYGRRKGNDPDSSESEQYKTSEDEADNQKNINENSNSNPFPSTAGCSTGAGNSGTIDTNSSTSVSDIKGQGKVNPRDRLKRKMQIQLNKQYKADKKAEIERTERQIQQQQEREDEMRELALKLRRRQRELRHKYGTPTPSPNSSSSESEPAIPTIISISAAPIINKEALKKIKEKSITKSKSRSKSKERRHPSRERYNSKRRSTSYHRRCKSPSGNHKDRRNRSRSSSRRRYQRTRSRSRDRRDRNRERYIDRRRDEHRYNRNYSRSRSRSHDHNYRGNRGRSKDRYRDKNYGISGHLSPKTISARRLVDY